MQIRTSVRAFCRARVRARDASRKRVAGPVTAQVSAQQKRTVQGAVFPTSDADTNSARAFCKARLDEQFHISFVNEWRVRLQLGLRPNKSEVCKTQCSRRAMQIRTSEAHQIHTNSLKELRQAFDVATRIPRNQSVVLYGVIRRQN